MVEETSAFLDNESNKEVDSEKAKPYFDPSQIEEHEEFDDAIIALEKFWYCEKLCCLKQLMKKASLALKKPIYIYQDQDVDIAVPLDQVVCTSELKNSCSITFSSDVYQFMKNHQNGAPLFMEYILKLELYKLIHSLPNHLAYGLSDHYEKKICQELYAHLFAVNKVTSPDLANLKATFYDFIRDESITAERKEFCKKYYFILIFIRIFYDINHCIIKMDWIHLTASHPFSLEDLDAANEGYKPLVNILKLTLLNMYIDQCVDDRETEKYLLNELLAVIDSVYRKCHWSVDNSLTDGEIKNRLLSFCVYCYAYKVTKSMVIADSLSEIIKFVDHERHQYYPISLTKMIISILKDKWTNSINKNDILQCIRWLSKLLKESEHKGLPETIIELVIRVVMNEHRLDVRSEVIKEMLDSLPNLDCYHKLWNQLSLTDQYYMLHHMKIRDVRDARDILVIDKKTLNELKIQWCLKVIQHRDWSISNKAKAIVRAFTLFSNIWSDEFYRVIQHCSMDMIKDLLQEISEIVHQKKEGVINSYILFLKDLANHVCNHDNLSNYDNLLLLIVSLLSYLSRNSTQYQLIHYIGSYLTYNWQENSAVNLVFAYWTFTVVHTSHTVIDNSINVILTMVNNMKENDKKGMILLAYYFAMRIHDRQLIELIENQYCPKYLSKKSRKEVAKVFDLNKQISSVESTNVHGNALFQEFEVFGKFITQFSQNADQHGFYSACKRLLLK